MIKDSEKGLGGLLAYEHPETKARRISDLNKQIRGTVTPLSDIDIDVFSSLPLATEVNLEANTKVTPGVAPPVTPKRKGPTQGQIYRGAMKHFARPKLTEQEKEFWGAWNNSDKMLKYVKKYTDVYAGENKPATDAPKKSMPDQLKALRHFGRNRLIERTEKESDDNNLVRKIK